MTLLMEEAEVIQRRLDASSIFIVRDVRYRPRWSIEVDEIIEAHPHRLPPDTTRRARRWIEAAMSARSVTAARIDADE